jgi:hypothetical protein
MHIMFNNAMKIIGEFHVQNYLSMLSNSTLNPNPNVNEIIW